MPGSEPSLGDLLVRGLRGRFFRFNVVSVFPSYLEILRLTVMTEDGNLDQGLLLFERFAQMRLRITLDAVRVNGGFASWQAAPVESLGTRGDILRTASIRICSQGITT